MREPNRLKERWVLADFLGELADLLRGGAGLREALDVAGRGESGRKVDQALERVTEEVASGTELGQALASHFPRLPDFCAERLRRAQRAGDLPEVAARMAEYMTRMQALSLGAGSVRKVFLYPAAVLVIGLLVVTLLLVFVIPQFESMFASFGSELPLLTRQVVDLAHFLGSYWWALLLGIIVLVLLLKWGASRSASLRRLPGRLAMGVPGLSRFYQLHAHAEISRTMAFVGALEGSTGSMLEAAEQAVGSGYARDELKHARQRVASGSSLADALAASPLFFSKLINIARIGESRGILEGLLSPLADRYALRMESAQGATRMLEPLLITLLALIIGTLVLAMYLPIFQIASVV